MGVYEGVVIHECLRVPRTQTGSGANQVMVGHALFLGAQACILAEGTAPRWEEERFDYKNQYGVAIDRMFGLKKSQFKYDENILDCINCGIRFIRRIMAALRPALLMSEVTGTLAAGEIKLYFKRARRK